MRAKGVTHALDRALAAHKLTITIADRVSHKRSNINRNKTEQAQLSSASEKRKSVVVLIKKDRGNYFESAIDKVLIFGTYLLDVNHVAKK